MSTQPYMKLSDIFSEDIIQSVIAFISMKGISAYIYGAPIQVKGCISNFDSKAVGRTPEVHVLPESVLSHSKVRDHGFYKLKQKAIELINHHRIKEIGRTADSPNRQFATYSPFADILEPEEGHFLVPCYSYYTSNIYISIEDLSESLQHFGEQVLVPNADKFLSSITNSTTSREQAEKVKNHPSDDYAETLSGEKLRLTHEATIDFLIKNLERDFEAGSIKETSELRSLLTKDGKFIDKKLADAICDESLFYFKDEKGFGNESLRKRIVEARKKFKIPKI